MCGVARGQTAVTAYKTTARLMTPLLRHFSRRPGGTGLEITLRSKAVTTKVLTQCVISAPTFIRVRRRQ